jgi:hypothetical protein
MGGASLTAPEWFRATMLSRTSTVPLGSTPERLVETMVREEIPEGGGPFGVITVATGA